MSLLGNWSGKEKLSEGAILIGEIFNSTDNGIEFLDSVLARFEHFDESNRAEGDKTFSNDINHILESSMASLTSENSIRFENRIDGYFYLYRRLEEYFAMKKRSIWGGGASASNLGIFRQKLYELLSSVFVSSKGEKPYLYTDNHDLLKRMNIPQHISFLKTIDPNTINLVFALCKLSMQSTISADRLKWIDILSKIPDMKLTLQQFIMQYVDYQSAFKEFPLDTVTYIYLIQRKHPLKQNSTKPFTLFISLLRTLNLKTEEFFDLFQPVFIKGIKDQRYETKDLSEFFRMFSTYDSLFDQYLSIYSCHVNNDELWKMFLHLCVISDINEIIRRHSTKILSRRICSVSMETFRSYTKSMKECLIVIKSEFRPHFIEIFERIYDVFISTQIPDSKYSSRFTPLDLKELIKIGLELTSTHSVKRPSCLLLLRESLFRIDNRIKNTAEKIKYLFDNFNYFDDNLRRNQKPSEIIDDDWLKDFLITNLQIWFKLDREIYQYLCNHHKGNSWITYLWTRLMHLSLLKCINDNSNEILVKLNEWMKNIKHEIYDSQDVLTSIFVQKVYEVVMINQTKLILSLPNVEIIFQWIFSIRTNEPNKIDTARIDFLIRNGRETLQNILQLQGTCSSYRQLLNGSILYSFLPFIDLKKILISVNPQFYQFVSTTPTIDAMMSLPKPNDIDITNIETFAHFIQHMNQWLQWFDRFLDQFQPIIEWLKSYNIIRVKQFYNDLHSIRDNPKITLIQTKTIIENISQFLQSITDLHRLCRLFNCLTSFRVVDHGTLNTRDSVVRYLEESKRSQSNNTFTIDRRGTYEHITSIPNRQQVQWSYASENHACDMKILYQTSDHSEILFEKENVTIHKHVLYGQFETSEAGQLIIALQNKQNTKSCKIWYRIKYMSLSTCQLFHGIFNLFYEKSVITREEELSGLLREVFAFIDKLLNGSLNLKDMNDLQSIFCDKNLHIQKEVRKLYTNRTNEFNPSNEMEIQQVCEWLQIYQYYSHINIIMDCVERFDLLPGDQTIVDLKRLSGNENCSLREITQAYRILHERFQNLEHHHLQLIKTAVECANVVQMMRKSDLYSKQGQHRFQELRDNLTTQFQLQEKNNLILNSWIMTYTLIEPFIFQAKNFEEFIARLIRLPNFEESSLNHIQIVNENMQIVHMWLSAEESTVLDNALITMEHLYKTGTVDIYLRHLMNEQSYFEIGYSIDRNQGQILDNSENRRVAEPIRFTLSMADVDDHKRQLTFCNVDVEQNVIYKKALIHGQLKLLQTVDKIYSNLIKLELAGHPDYQFFEEHYGIDLQFGQNQSILSDLRNHQNIQLEHAIKTKTARLQSTADTLQAFYDVWMKNLGKSREECCLLKLFSNRQIMLLIILLRTSSAPNSIRNRFLKNLIPFQDLTNQNAEEAKLSIQCLKHYLRSLRINQCDLSENRILDLYTTHQIQSGLNVDLCLKKLSQFLRDLFLDGQELLNENSIVTENQQYLIRLNPIERQPEQITFEHDFNLDACCILLNIFNNQLPSAYQILWCSNAMEEDIHLFFSRIRTFRSLTFAIMEIDQMHHRLRETLFNEQDLLTREQKAHGIVYYFSRELTTSRKGLREFQIPAKYQHPRQTYAQLTALFSKHQSAVWPQIQIVYGTAGIGKTHRIYTQYNDQTLSCFSINDKLNLSLLISSFLLFDSKTINENPTVYFNISIHAPFEALNRTLFSLFICGSLNDSQSGLTFSLPIDKPWKFVIEIPYSDITQLTIKKNFDQILPFLSITSPSNLEEVTSENYRLFIGEEEELVARFLKAFENGTIDRLSTTLRHGIDEEVKFDRIINPEECRDHIYNCMNLYAPELPRNKIYELSFTKFLYRRVQFFLGHYYRLNQTTQQLGSIAMRQMINEAKALSQMSFKDQHFPRVYLVYDPWFSLRVLHVDWEQVPDELKSLFGNFDPSWSMEYQDKDYFALCLAWLIDIRYEIFMDVIKDAKFILTENFAYKLFHVHERKLTKLALIIEGDTGVGKTFLLKFYSLLLNAKNLSLPSDQQITPRLVENSGRFLHGLLVEIGESQINLLNTFLLRIKLKLSHSEKDDGEQNNLNENVPTAPNQEEAAPIDPELLQTIKLSLLELKYEKKILYHIWETILTASSEQAMTSTSTLIQAMHDYITTELANYPLIEASSRLTTLLQEICSPTANMSIEIFKEYILSSQIKPVFYRLLLHPGTAEEEVVAFMSPICQLARELPHIELVVFFDEVNTSSCLGLFKEMFMDRTLHGVSIPKNIYFTAAINPLLKVKDQDRVHRSDYLVHELPQSLKHLIISYGSLESRTLADYIARKMVMFQTSSSKKVETKMPFDRSSEGKLAHAIAKAHTFCEERLGKNSVSQREIQRCFNLIEFFWNRQYDDEVEVNPTRCIALSIALIYYFRLPTTEDNLQRNDTQTPSREELARALSQTLVDFEQIIQNELLRFVNKENFLIPPGVAINQAVREHIFSIVVSIITRTPLCIIGVPGQSKTLSFQIVLQNLQGSQLSSKAFCKCFPAIDPFFSLGSKYSRSEDIAYIFERAIRREQQYQQNKIDTRCVVFLDEASLPNEKKMVLKVLHPYLDECRVAFVAVANRAFDAANANRMICIYRSAPSETDQKILAYGCLGLQTEQDQRTIDSNLEMIISGICQGYRRVLRSSEIPKIFHDRDLIYMLRELRFELANIHENQETSVGEITPRSLLRAIEENFNGIQHEEFEKLVEIFFTAVNEKCPSFRLLSSVEKQQIQRNIPTILRESMKLDPTRRRLYGRYKLIIDESEDESAVRLLSQTHILDSDPNRTNIFRMSDFPDDINSELRNVEILSTIKLCMETGKTILMVNTGRIHGSLYDVFNQNFSIMATDESRKIFSKVAIGPKTIDVIVHEDFQCIVHVKRSEFEQIPAPFLSRFQKYSLSVIDFYRIELEELPEHERNILENVEKKIQTFIQHFGEQYFYGYNGNTLYSCLLSLIKRKENGESYLSNPHRSYTQLTIKSKSFIEQKSEDLQQCLLLFIISKLLQLLSPESMIYKLPTFEGEFSQVLCQNYFYQQEHFNIENFLQRLISSPSIDIDPYDLFTLENDFNEKLNEIFITTKVMMFTRTSSFVLGLNQQTKNDQFTNSTEPDCTNISEKMDVLNLTSIENSAELHEQFHNYEQAVNKQVLIIIIDTRITQQCCHIPFVRQMIDKTDKICNSPTEPPRKFFLLLLHSSGQEVNPKSSFPSIFLHDWDYHFLDTSTPGSAFHLQKILQMFTSSFGKQVTSKKEESIDNTLCDYNSLFDDCLWEFCSRLQVSLHKMPKEMFENSHAYEFYQPQTSTIRRVQCLKELLRQSTRLQERIVTNYHENQSRNREFLQKKCRLNYQISKEILCGKRLTSLVDSFQSEIRISFVNFVSNFLKFFVNDCGLETLSKLSTTQHGYDLLLHLIDYSSFSTNDEDENVQRNFSIRLNYFFVPQTPLYSFLHERIKSIADVVKSSLVEKQNQCTDDLRRDYYAEPYRTTTNNYFDHDETLDQSSEQFRTEFIKALMKDKILTKIVSRPILLSYTNDSVQKLCTSIETNFNRHLNQSQKSIEFISNWLLSIDENEEKSFTLTSNRDIWLLAHVYSSIQSEQNDIFSLYSACRILESLDQTEFLSTEPIIRSEIRENLFRLLFDHFWTTLRHFCSTSDHLEPWIHSYTFISKYYPSEKVLQRGQLIQIQDQIELMNLAYLIFLNEETPEPKALVLQLLQDPSLIQENRMMYHGTSICLQSLPTILETIHRYFDAKNANSSTLMIDIQQWILSNIKASNRSCQQEILYFFQFLNQSKCQLSFSMKQCLFNQLADIYFQTKKSNRQNHDVWDRLSLLSVIIECLSDRNLEHYQLPYHPSVVINNSSSHILIDLYFFYLHRLLNLETIKYELIHKILLSRLPQISERSLIPAAEILFKQLKDYFLLQTTALLLCQSDSKSLNQRESDRILRTIIEQYLSIDRQSEQLSKDLQLFFSIIIAKRSWSFLLNLFQSDRFQRVNAQWSSTLDHLLGSIQSSQSLHIPYRLQFTLTTNTTLSILPRLHQPYEELSTLIDQCTKNNDQQQLRWKPFIDWIQLELTSDPPLLNATEIKVMLLLNIYYDYYCHNRLIVLDSLLTVVENMLQPLPEELRVFRAFLQPARYMIGYPVGEDHRDENEVNNLFRLDCTDNEELRIRHALVNLLAMILLSGEQNFLWTFTFDPVKLQDTFGFGSVRHEMVQRNNVHYDCGCILTQNGDLEAFIRGNVRGNALNIPAVYVAFFSTFGALTWHLLLFDNSTENLYGPTLTATAIDDATVIYRLAGNSTRAKVCHFVRARLLSTYHFLSIHSNEDDACILLNRCFEQMAHLTRPENAWIKPIYTTFEEKIEAEREYQNQIFYPIHQQLVEYKKFINTSPGQSEIQRSLQEYVSQIPIWIEFKDFKTELSHPRNSQLPLNLLRYILESLDFLKMTHWIYDLSQFYILLHRTYGQLVERNEFTVITLKELHDRGDKQSKDSNHFKYPIQNNKHLSMIQNGIKAVNAYHEFANGLIQPGACDETQRFTRISIDTPISYLVTTENHDEGDIIMRILSVMVDYHNRVLDLLEETIENSGIDLLRNLINELTSKEISILQVAQDNTGVIALNDQDCLWIEQLSRASLETNEYFLKSETERSFNFIYVQSYIIRSYLLLCRINYRHISQKYSFYIPRQAINLVTGEMNDGFEDEWNHLNHLSLDKLTNGHHLLRRTVDLFQTSADDSSKQNLYEYLQTIDSQRELIQQCEQNQIKDFPLDRINYVCQLYEKAIDHFQHSFLNVSHLLRIPIETRLKEQLDELFDQVLNPADGQQEKEKLQCSIQSITDLLNDLRDAEEFLLTRSSRSLRETCHDLRIKNSILDFIPADLKCQHYVPFGLKLIEIRSQLQEKSIEFEEANTQLWNANFDIPVSEEQNVFQRFKRTTFDLAEDTSGFFDLFPPSTELEPNVFLSGTTDGRQDMDLFLIDFDDFPLNPSPERTALEPITYTSLFELKIKSIPFATSVLYNDIRQRADLSTTTVRLLHYTMVYADGTSQKYMCKMENLSEQFTKVFKERNYDPNRFVIVDRNHLFVNFLDKNSTTLRAYLSEEYRVVEKSDLISVLLEYQEKQMEYLVTRDSRIASIINRFLIDQKIQLTPEETILGVFDELGRYIEEDSPIDAICRSNPSRNVRLRLIRYENQMSKLGEITLRSKEGEQTIQCFDLRTNWKQVIMWLQTQNSLTDIPVDTCHLWDCENKNLLDKEQFISSILADSTSITIEGIIADDVMKVIFSDDKNEQMIWVLKSCPVSHLLNNPHYFREFNFNKPSNDCILVLVKEAEERILSNEDIEQPIGHYSTSTDHILHLRISVLLHLIQYDSQEELQITISNRHLTIKQFLESNHIFHHLALIDTLMILPIDQKLSDLNQTKFYLVPEAQTCSISIEQTANLLIETDDQTILQQYIITATIADILKQNISIVQGQYLVYENDFIPSPDISLTSFLPTASPIQFKLTNGKFPVNVTVMNEEEQIAVQFFCSSSISIERVCQLACRLGHFDENLYRLAHLENSDVEYNDLTDEFKHEIRLKLTLIADVKCQVIYGEQRIIIPANNEMLASTILQEVLKKFSIPNEDIQMYKLNAMDDLERPSDIDLNLSIEDIRSLFPENAVFILFQLQKI